MEKRYGCFEILSKCSYCGQPVPVNGPFENIVCSGCFKTLRISKDTLGGFFNGFDEEHEAFDRGEGSGGTLIGGGTFEYSYWHMEPRCSECKTTLPEFDLNTDETIHCEKCNAPYYVYPALDLFKDISPAVKQFISREKIEDNTFKAGLNTNETERTPIVLSCPKCGGALSVTEMSERIMKCEYCSAEVYVPDAVWQRLHPVKGTSKWYVRFEGKTLKQLAAERRKQDLIDEKAEMAKHQSILKPLKKKRGIQKYLLIGIPSLVLFFIVLAALMYLFNFSQEEIQNTLAAVIKVLFIVFIVFITLAGALHPFIGFRVGKQKQCKEAMAVLAESNGWKHEGAEYKSYMGSIRDHYKGVEFEIHPNDDYAVDVDLNNSPFYLKTENPAYPGEELFRFSSGDERFDNFFPIRYAKPAIVRKMESSEAYKTKLLSPLNWFLDRWETQLACIKIDWSEFSVHLFPGYSKSDFSAGRYLLPEQIEALLQDMAIFAGALEDVLRGKEPDLS